MPRSNPKQPLERYPNIDPLPTKEPLRGFREIRFQKAGIGVPVMRPVSGNSQPDFAFDVLSINAGRSLVLGSWDPCHVLNVAGKELGAMVSVKG